MPSTVKVCLWCTPVLNLLSPTKLYIRVNYHKGYILTMKCVHWKYCENWSIWFYYGAFRLGAGPHCSRHILKDIVKSCCSRSRMKYLYECSVSVVKSWKFWVQGNCTGHMIRLGWAQYSHSKGTVGSWLGGSTGAVRRQLKLGSYEGRCMVMIQCECTWRSKKLNLKKSWFVFLFEKYHIES